MRFTTLILCSFYFAQLTSSNCPCCNLNFNKPVCQNYTPILRTNPLPSQLILPTVPDKRNQTIHPKPVPPFKDGLWITSAPADVYREDDIWRKSAIQLMWDERKTVIPTPLIDLKSPGLPNVEFLFKDESFTPTSSSSYRLAWRLIFWGLVEGLIHKGAHVVDASFGNAAIAEAYFMQILGLNYTAVVSEQLDSSRQTLLKTYKANVVFANASQLLMKAEEIAASGPQFVFINQYANAKHTLVMEENHFSTISSINIMDELTQKLFAEDKQPILPNYFVVPASTGSTISSIGHFVKRHNLPVEVVLADTEFSAYFDHVIYNKFTNDTSEPSLWIGPGLDGLGFGQFESAFIDETTSLNPHVIDRAIKVPDLASVAAMHFLRSINIDAGPATGLSFITALSIATKQTANRQAGQKIQIALLISDPGRFYNETYYSKNWLDMKMAGSGGFKTMECWLATIKDCFQTAKEPLGIGAKRCPSPVQELLINL